MSQANLTTFVMTIVILVALGCAEKEPTISNTNQTANNHQDHDHSHGDEAHSAKHGGILIELGHQHEYHAELADDHDTGTVTVYIMDGEMNPHFITSSTVTLVLTAGENTQTFELQASQPDGSDQFTSSDVELNKMLHKHDLQGKLRVTIDGKPHSGTFDTHEHDDDGHSHDDHDH